jgi:Ion channel
MLVTSPYLERPGWPMVLFRLLGAAIFLSAIYAVATQRRNWIIALVLAGPAAALHVMVVFRSDPWLVAPTAVFTVLFLAFTIVSLLRPVIAARRVTTDTIYGAVSVYLLMALAWGTAYFLLATLQPGAISMDAARHPHHAIDWSDCVFYSYVTLTSLGYGDMVPVTAQARSLSILEAVSGIMYVAVLIARLVGVYSSSTGKADSAT